MEARVADLRAAPRLAEPEPAVDQDPLQRRLRGGSPARRRLGRGLRRGTAASTPAFDHLSRVARLYTATSHRPRGIL